jgi:hypothetical protein
VQALRRVRAYPGDWVDRCFRKTVKTEFHEMDWGIFIFVLRYIASCRAKQPHALSRHAGVVLTADL